MKFKRRDITNTEVAQDLKKELEKDDKPKKISELTKKELEDEINGIEQTMEYCAYGVRDMMYQDALFKEARKRGYEVQKNIKIKLVRI